MLIPYIHSIEMVSHVRMASGEQIRGLIVLYILFVSIRLGILHKIQFWRPGIYFFFSVGAAAPFHEISFKV